MGYPPPPPGWVNQTMEYKFADGTDARQPLNDAAGVIWRLARQMGIHKPIRFYFHPGFMTDPFDGSRQGPMAYVYGVRKDGTVTNMLNPASDPSEGYLINLWLGHHRNVDEAWTHLSHEFGHLLMAEKYTHNASPLLKIAIDEAYQRFRAELQAKGGITYINDIFRLRENWVAQWYDLRSHISMRRGPGEESFPPSGTLWSAIPRDKQKYWLEMEEWFAEQVAKHFTTSPPVLNAVDRFFASLARSLRQVYD